MLPGFVFARVPSDPLIAEQWYLQKINAAKAWKRATGSRKVIVAVIDTGVDLKHPDLQKSLWKNKKEIPNDGIDNDMNGFVDDYDGWDFIDEDNDPRPELDPGSQLTQSFGGQAGAGMTSHGTMIASIIGAVGNNNIGISEMAWNVRIMPVRAMAIDGGGETKIVAKAIDYAVKMKADIINLSLVGFEDDPVLKKSITKAWKKNVVIVSAAGNEMTDLNKYPAYPVCYYETAEKSRAVASVRRLAEPVRRRGDPSGSVFVAFLAHRSITTAPLVTYSKPSHLIDSPQSQRNTAKKMVIGVTAVDQKNKRLYMANYGNRCVDIAAPGANIPWSPDGKRIEKTSGTSAAAAMVSGAAALLKSARPKLSNKKIYKMLRKSVTKGVLDMGKLGYRNIKN